MCSKVTSECNNSAVKSTQPAVEAHCRPHGVPRQCPAFHRTPAAASRHRKRDPGPNVAGRFRINRQIEQAAGGGGLKGTCRTSRPRSTMSRRRRRARRVSASVSTNIFMSNSARSSASQPRSQRPPQPPGPRPLPTSFSAPLQEAAPHPATIDPALQAQIQLC